MSVPFRCFIVFLIFCLNTGCQNKAKNEVASITINVDPNNGSETQMLSQFFVTDEILLDSSERRLNVNIGKSAMIQAKKEKMGLKWVNAEADASIAAMKLANSVDDRFDSISFRLKVSDKFESYSFSSLQLKNAHQYLVVCKKFCQSLGKKDINQIQPFFSFEIVNSMNKQQLAEFISKAFFLDEKINELKLKGLKIVHNKYSLYLDLCYAESGCQTYGFSFLEGNDRIAGLQVVH